MRADAGVIGELIRIAGRLDATAGFQHAFGGCQSRVVDACCAHLSQRGVDVVLHASQRNLAVLDDSVGAAGVAVSRPRTTIAGAGGSPGESVGIRATARPGLVGASWTAFAEILGGGADSSDMGLPLSDATVSQAATA